MNGEPAPMDATAPVHAFVPAPTPTPVRAPVHGPVHAPDRAPRPFGSVRGSPASGFVPMARVAALIAALALVGIVHVWSRTRVTAAGYRLGELQRTQESLRAQRDRLVVEVATLRAPGRLEEFARTRLKMAPPAAGTVTAGRGGEAAGRAETANRGGGARAPAGPMVVSAATR